MFLQLSPLCSRGRGPGGLSEGFRCVCQGYLPKPRVAGKRGARALRRSCPTPSRQLWETSLSGPHPQQTLVLFTKYFLKNECQVQEMQCKLLKRSTSAT